MCPGTIAFSWRSCRLRLSRSAAAWSRGTRPAVYLPTHSQPTHLPTALPTHLTHQLTGVPIPTMHMGPGALGCGGVRRGLLRGPRQVCKGARTRRGAKRCATNSPVHSPVHRLCACGPDSVCVPDRTQVLRGTGDTLLAEATRNDQAWRGGPVPATLLEAALYSRRARLYYTLGACGPMHAGGPMSMHLGCHS